MKRLTASILAVGLAAAAGSASAQSAYGYSGYGQPSVSRYGQYAGAYYDYARVLRVDPVIVAGYGEAAYRGRGYATSNAQRCYREQGRYPDNRYGNDGDRYSGYRNAGYGRAYDADAYRDAGYSNDGYGNGGYGNYGSRPSNAGANVATVIGGLIGAAVGSQVGGGSARYATAAIGSMVGGMAGRQVYDNTRRPMRTASVVVCDPIPVNQAYGSGYADRDAGGYGAEDSRVSGYDVTYEYAGRTYTTRTGYNPGNRIRVRVDVSPG